MPLNMLQNIPLELRQIPNWVAWRKELTEDGKETKIPYNPKTGFKASPTNPEHWGTFEQACSVMQHCDGIGFVLTSTCGYVCIDLDPTEDTEEIKLQENIYNAFESYAEISPSGKGLHIWIKASLPSGRKRKPVEIYPNARFMTFTGNVFRNAPIKDCQELAFSLWSEMESSEVITSDKDEPQKYSDYEILEMASDAVNGKKFIDLFEGRWQDYYEDDPKKVSCNEADFALVNMLGFYSGNREQIVRLFHQSALGKRDKAKRVQYLNYMLNRVFDNRMPELDLSGLKQNLEAKLLANLQATTTIEELPPTPTMPSLEIAPQTANAEVEISPEPDKTCNLEQTDTVNEKKQTKSVKAVKSPYDLPPGLLGMIASFIYEAAPRPVPEIALAGAIGLMSGVCGRSYNISGTGLNTYTFLLAKTGRGKEAMRKGINKLIACACKTVPAANIFMGPAKIASPEALIKYIDKASNSFVAILGEFADTLKKMSNDSRNPQQQGVRIAMLDLYNQSGKGDVLGSLIYSDKDKNTNASAAPAFSVVGESTPEKFYELLSKEMITEGLLPRCTIIEYDGNRTQLNENHFLAKPSQQLEDQFSALCAYSLQLNNGNNILEIKISDEAKQLIDDYDKHCDYKVNNGNEISSELWTRAHMKVLKLAGLLAVGCNYINPTVDVVCAEWALRLITHDVETLVTRFEVGEVGTASVQNDQVDDLKKAFKRYVTSEFESVKGYPGISLTLWSLKVVPQSFLTAYCRSRSSFKNDKLGPIQAIRTCLASMCECDEIRELSLQDKRQRNLPLNPKLYVISGMVI